MEQTLTFHDWKELLLHRRGLPVPDGRPLYQYRLTEFEFLALEGFLQERISNLHLRFGLDYIAERPGFADLFVLYCSEWWRRRYDGSGYAWEPILAALGAHSETWNANERSDCVRDGLHGWKLRTLRTGGHRYLGAVALQGGLPLRLLADERGRISQVISRVLRLARRTVESPQELQSWVESLQTLLPVSYRQREIYTLLADVAWTVLDLKNQAELTSGSNAIAKLNHIVPGWRERFPLPIDDNHAIALIEHLVREAATIRVDKQSLILPIDRHIERSNDGMWTLRSSLDLPERIDSKLLAKLFDIEVDDLPRTGELQLIAGGKARLSGVRKMAGHDSFRINRTPWGFSGEIACDEHLLKFVSIDGRGWTTLATKGQALDESLPWVFSGESESPRFVRQGSGSIAEKGGFVAIPSNWSIQVPEGSPLESNGSLPEFARNIFSIEGQCMIVDSAGNEFRIRTGNAAAIEESFEWLGNRFWYGFKSPSVAFKGKPQLYSVDEDGFKKKITGELGVTVIGSPTARAHIGPVHLKYPATGEVKHRTRMVLLPEDSKLKILPDSPRSGVIYFEGWGLRDAKVEAENISSRFVSNDGNALLELNVAEGCKAPDEIEITAYWPHTTTPAKLLLPFPAKGVRLFDGSGNEIQQGERIAVQQLVGTRLVVLGASQYSRMILSLRASDKDISRKFEIKNNEGLLSLAVRISDFRSDIEQIQTIDDNPDSSAILELILDGSVEFTCKVTRYTYQPEREDGNIWVDFGAALSSLTDLESGPKAVAMRLEAPGEEARQLTAIGSSEVGVAKWSFEPAEMGPGPWLLFPPSDSSFYFRPTRWFVPGEVIGTDPYQVAILTKDEVERHEKLDQLIFELAADFTHPNWTDVEQLATQIGHLPLATVDIWKRFARSSKGMAALFLRYSDLNISFLFRFASELPFAWETVSARDWSLALELSGQQCRKIYGEELFQSVFSGFVEARMNDLVAETGSLNYLLGIVRSAISDDARSQMEQLKIGGRLFEGFLFTGEFSPLNKLRQRHSSENEEWPADLWDATVAGAKDTNVAKYVYKERLGFQDSVINLPLLLAAQVCCERSNKWFEDPKMIHQLRQYKNFDPDWFDDAFNQTVARCLADGHLDIHQIL